jgi:tetratricopeptide (TPR) repeat protein
MPFELQHAALPSFANAWPEEVSQLIAARLGSEIPAEDVRTIVLSITSDRQRLGVWINTEWENYPYAEDVTSAAGFVSLAPWLDGVDAIARGEKRLAGPSAWAPQLPLEFADEVKTASLRSWWLELHRALTATAIELGTRRLAKHFTQPVGVFVSMTGSEARLAAFCHPDGAPLWPIRERRREHGYSSVYAHGTLGADAMTMFYAKGEGADDEGTPSIRRRTTSEIESATFEDDELSLKFAGEPFPIAFSNGHTSEEMGGPDNAEVAVALRDFATRAGKLGGVEPRVELPDASSFQAAFDAQGEEWSGWLERLVTTHGAKVVSERVFSLSFGAKRMQDLHRRMASLASDVEAWDVVLPHFALLEGKVRSDWQWLEVRSLVALSRWDDVLARPAPQKKGREEKTPERALALFKTGQLAAAQEQLADSSEGDALAVRAMIEAETSPAQATETMTRALSDGIRPHLEVHVRAHPLLSRLRDEAAAFDAALEASFAGVVAIPPSTLDHSAQVELHRPAAEVIFASKPTEDGEHKFRHVAALSDGWLVADDDERVVEVREGAAVTPRWEGDVENLVSVPQGVVVASKRGLVLLDAHGAEVAKLSSTMRFTGQLASRGTLVACGFGPTVRLARVEGSTLRWCGAIKANERVYVTSFGFVGDDRLLLASSEGLVLVDCADVMNLRPRVRVAGSFELLGTWTNRALLRMDQGATLLDVEALRALWTVELEHKPILAQSRDGRLALASRGEVLLIDEKTLQTERRLMLDAEGSAFDDALAVRVEVEKVLAITPEHGLRVLERVPFDAGALKQRVETDLPRVRAWVSERVEQWLTEGVSPHTEEETDEPPASEPFGGVTGAWMQQGVRLSPQGPRTVINTTPGYTQLEFERDEANDARDDGPLAQAVERVSFTLSTQLREAALAKVLREVVTRVAPRTQVRELFVGIESARLTITDVIPGGGTLPPFREVVKPPAPRTLRELMNGRNWYGSVDAWAQRAKRDPAFRAEVLSILSEGQLPAAARVALQLLDVDREACARSWFSAADVELELALPGLLALGEKGHAEARQRLTTLCDSPEPQLALPARRVLGRLDEDATLALVRTRLEGLEEYDDDGVPVLTLAALSDARLNRLQDALLDTKEKLARPEVLFLPLLRTGWTLDNESLESGHEKRLQDDDFMGELFGDDEPDALATAVRFVLAKQVVERVRRGEGWPDAPLEKSRLGWQRFFTVAWPLWEREGVLEQLFTVLPGLAAASKPADEETLGADARFALQVLQQALMRGDARATAYAAALEVAALPAAARQDVARLARSSRLMFGWSLLKQRRLAEARKVADAALADAPEDGQVRFFDARLCWLEHDDPRAALPRIEAGLLAAADGVGRARLLNLEGAVWDAVGDFQKALAHFHKALAVSESRTLDHDTGERTGDTSMTHAILSNIAEAHWKLGQRDEARSFADQAARRGSTTDIVKTILSEAP